VIKLKNESGRAYSTMSDTRNANRLSTGNTIEKIYIGNLGVDVNIMLK
jgi:hypothetical protein